MTNRNIGFEIRTVSNLIKRRINQRVSCSLKGEEKDQFTVLHSWVIGYLDDHRDRDVFSRDLETAFSMRRSTAAGILRLMEQNGLIVRESVPYDARLKKIVLTDKAVALNKVIHQEVNHVEQQLADNLTPRETEEFYRIMDKLKHNLEDGKHQ